MLSAVNPRIVFVYAATSTSFACRLATILTNAQKQGKGVTIASVIIFAKHTRH
jgi:hypothetical protein